MDQRIETGDLPAQIALLQRVLNVSDDSLKAELHVFPIELIPLYYELGPRKVLKRILHGLSLHFQLGPNGELRFDRKF